MYQLAVFFAMIFCYKRSFHLLANISQCNEHSVKHCCCIQLLFSTFHNLDRLFFNYKYQLKLCFHLLPHCQLCTLQYHMHFTELKRKSPLYYILATESRHVSQSHSLHCRTFIIIQQGNDVQSERAAVIYKTFIG